MADLYEVVTRVIHDTSGQWSQGEITNRACPVIMPGMSGINSYHFQVEHFITDDFQMAQSAVKPSRSKSSKPPYAVPTMTAITDIPWNGYNVVSTFSGAGGSCLVYRMAGFRVLWANEFVPAAQDTYKLNHPNSILNTSDIRELHPGDILSAINLQVGELDLFDGSPPCASFSTAGKREKGWGKQKAYSDTAQRTDDLFFEYSRMIRGLQPKTFVAENVSGLVKGKAKGYFLEILAELKHCGYEVSAKLLNAKWLGVPQARERLIFVGVRNDLVERFDVHPTHPKPLPYTYTVRDVIPWITRIRVGGALDNWESPDRPSATIVQSDGARTNDTAYMSSYLVESLTDAPHVDDECRSVQVKGKHSNPKGQTKNIERRKFSIAELRRICGFPDDFQLSGDYAHQWERLGRAVPPVMMSHIAKAVQTEILDKCRV